MHTFFVLPTSILYNTYKRIVDKNIEYQAYSVAREILFFYLLEPCIDIACASEIHFSGTKIGKTYIPRIWNFRTLYPINFTILKNHL